MAPQRSTSSIFLQTPRVFQLRYIYNQGDTPGEVHPFLPKMKACALKNIEVSHTPDGSYMTYENGSPTAVGMKLSFEELVPCYEDNYDSKDDVGY